MVNSNVPAGASRTWMTGETSHTGPYSFLSLQVL
jgi:hypothetical protein